MIDVLAYEIDDIQYLLIDELKINGTEYLYLSNIDDENDIIFRKRDKDDAEVLLPLKDLNEVKMVALVFANKVLDA